MGLGNSVGTGNHRRAELHAGRVATLSEHGWEGTCARVFKLLLRGSSVVLFDTTPMYMTLCAPSDSALTCMKFLRVQLSLGRFCQLDVCLCVCEIQRGSTDRAAQEPALPVFGVSDLFTERASIHQTFVGLRDDFVTWVVLTLEM